MDCERRAQDLLVHGMPRDELTDVIGSIFERMDEDGSGMLSKQEFLNALTSMEVGLTRREINTIMLQVDLDDDGNISYREFVPFAFDLLQKMASLRLLEAEMEGDELAQFLLDLFKAKDVDNLGLLHVDDVRDLLHQAMLGLSRMQIYTVLSEVEANADMMINYNIFVPRAVKIIHSLLSFDKSVMQESHENVAEAEQNFFSALDEYFIGQDTIAIDEFAVRLEECNLLSVSELQAVRNLLHAFGDYIPVDEAKYQIWTLCKNMRRFKTPKS